MAGFRRSGLMYGRALRAMVGGVSSPVRAFGGVGGRPVFIRRGEGQWIWDVDGNRFVDYVCSWGALILGHANQAVASAASQAVKSGSSFGAPTVQELELAEKIKASFGSIDKIRFVNSGTEATMSAVRLARAYTGKGKVIKFRGCYHGHADAFLAEAGSGLATFGISSSPGVPANTTRDTITVDYNSVTQLEAAFKRNRDGIAAVIVEPVAGNMGVVPPERGFLDATSRMCRENGALLILDEVITGFRVSIGGAQRLYGIRPDITCLGKIIGGGFPVGAYGARKSIMKLVAPEGPVYQAGTLSGNPVAMAAGLATISQLNAATYRRLETLASELEEGISDGARRAGVEISMNRVGSMMSLFFTNRHIRNFSDAKSIDAKRFGRFFWRMLKHGVYLPPSGFESMFVSAAHSEAEVRKTVATAELAFREV